jgi:hypothetical protein
MSNIDGELAVKEDRCDPPRHRACCAKGKEFARYLGAISAVISLQFDAECRSLIRGRPYSNECSPTHARMLIKDTFARYAEKGF